MRQLGMVAILVLCACATSFGAITVGAGAPTTLTYSDPADLDTVIDPLGVLFDVVEQPGMSKAAFLALNPQVVTFNQAPPKFTNKLSDLVVSYSATGTVRFIFPAADKYTSNFQPGQLGYSYGGANGSGRSAFSGSDDQDDISTAPSMKDTGPDANCVDISITSTGGKAVGAIGFCWATRTVTSGTAKANGGPVTFTLADIATGAVSTDTTTIVLQDFGGSTGRSKFFIGYQAPVGKTITRIQIPDTDSGFGTLWNMTTAIDDLSFVMVPVQQPLIGDINKDGYVNVGDLQALVAAWGSQKTPPSANWSADADINTDDYVNVGDLQLLVAHWGESQP